MCDRVKSPNVAFGLQLSLHWRQLQACSRVFLLCFAHMLFICIWKGVRLLGTRHRSFELRFICGDHERHPLRSNR